MILDVIIPPASSTINCAALFSAATVTFGSLPFSYTLAASVLSKCLVLVRLILPALKCADSKNILAVSSVTPDSKPPNTPAIHSPLPFPSQIIKSSALSFRVDSSKALNSVPSASFFTTIFLEGILSASNACNGCPISCNTKLVISTITLIGLTSIALRYFCIQSGDGPIFTFDIVIPLYLGHATLSITSTSNSRVVFSVLNADVSGILTSTISLE